MSVTLKEDTEGDAEDRSINPTGPGGGPTGTPGVPCNAPDVSPPAGTSTANQPRPAAPAGSSTNNQPRPEDFMSGGGEY